ncbi:MAG: hypothetical protein LBJ11_05890 [Oscillospiraceae bacterium]|jgi:hypothetical protein|nr:hypothetical protein [Oscillospiraceae bacterium]
MRERFRAVPKRVLSALLALLLLLSTLAVSASAKAACTCNHLPRIHIHGIGDPLYLNQDTPDEQQVGIVDSSHLQDVILPIIGKVIAATAKQSWDEGADAISLLAKQLFGQLQCDEKGNSVLSITNRSHLDPKQDHKKNEDYFFHYDWRADPMRSGKELYEYIEQVKKATGHSKVQLMPYSEGGVIAMAYLAQYGAGSVDHIVPVVSAHGGVTMVGELFNRNISLSANQAADYIVSYLGTMDGMETVSALIEVLRQAGLFDQLVKALSLLIEHVKDKLFQDTLIPLFVQWPALWGFVPDQYYASAKKSMFGNDPKYKDFIKMIDNYHTRAGTKSDALLKSIVAAGGKVSIVAAYGYPAQPFVPSPYAADGLIDTALESSGATCALHGQAFPANVKQKIADGHNHFSPDRKIDASTCLFPESTWFLKDGLHFAIDQPELLDFLLKSKTQPKITSNKKYPQFLTVLGKDDLVLTTNAPDPVKPRNLPAAALAFFGSLAGWLWGQITGLF